MKSVEDILEKALVGKTLVRREFDDEGVTINRKIVEVRIVMDESREDTRLMILLENDHEYENRSVMVYPNEGLEVK